MHKEWVEFLNSNVSGCNATLNEAEVGDHSITVDAAHIKSVCSSLRDGEHAMNVLHVITGTDYPESGEIEISYILSSYSKNTELILKVRVPRGTDQDLPKVDSVVDVWKSADFQERECYDMIGVDFVGHPDPRRILTPDDWKGHPLRKDYVVEEVYNGMVVNPEAKINQGDFDFAAKLKMNIADPTIVSGSWIGHVTEEFLAKADARVAEFKKAKADAKAAEKDGE